MKVLVTGGAGYIGSHTTTSLLNEGHEVIVYDNLSSGPKAALNPKARFYLGDVRDSTLLTRLMKDLKIEAVIHLAAKSNLQESLQDPLSYYEHNVWGVQNVIKAMVANNIKYLVFSSSAAVYGNEVQDRALVETDALKPITPYGQTKVMGEQIIRDSAQAYGFCYSILRYFNVAGAALDGSNGERTPKPFHLIHLAAQVAVGKRKELEIFGEDFNTSDKTAVRDFVHIEDVAELHIRALTSLEKKQNSTILNCGYGRGYSVKDVVTMMKKVSGVDFPTSIQSRHPHTPDHLVANSKKAQEELSWEPRFNDLELICKSALEWERNVAVSS